jgi:serine O-acetyltransferase
MSGPLGRLLSSIRADYSSVQRYRAKYHGDRIPTARLPLDVVRKIGLQMTTAIRVMQFLRDCQLPLLPQVASRLIRHLYAAEIHWAADIAPGISIVHGNGLVIGHGARVGPGCILFHNVTLGKGRDPQTGEVGTPVLEEDVHVGPGSTLIGPIRIGRGTKIMAGVVLAESVPPFSLVRMPAPLVTARGQSSLEDPAAAAGEPRMDSESSGEDLADES